MKKKAVWFFSAFILVSIVLLFGISDALAIYPYPQPPTSCTMTDAKGVEKPGYTLQIWPCQAAGETSSCVPGEWPIKRTQSDGSTQYEWRYKWSGVVSANQVSTVVPICVPSQIIYDPVPSASGEYIDGSSVYTTGDPTTSFGVWTSFEKVIRIPQVQAMGTLYGFKTKSDFMSLDPLPARNTYMQLKSGNNLFYCRDIAGPDCPNELASTFNPIVTTTDFELPNPLYPDYSTDALLKFRYLRNTNSCITKVLRGEKNEVGNWNYTEIPWVPATFAGSMLTQCKGTDLLQCNDCLVEIAGSPHTTGTSSTGQLAQLTKTCLTGEKKIYGTDPATGKFGVIDCKHSKSSTVGCPLCNGPLPKCGEKCCTDPNTESTCSIKTNTGVDCFQ